MLLDTCFLVDLLRDAGAAKKKAEELDDEISVKAVSCITALELWRGALRCTKKEEEMKKIDELLHTVLQYPLGEQEAKKAAEIEVDLLQKGEIIDWEDILIAATALVHNKPLLTRNIKHFSKIQGLQIEKY